MNAESFLNILGDLRKTMPQVDLGNMAREVPVSPRVAAVEKIVQKIPGADWGWKGGKPGELTGGIYDQLGTFGNPEYLSPWAQKWLKNWYQQSPTRPDFTLAYLTEAAKKALSKTPEFRRRMDIQPYMETSIMRGFKLLEDADVPREWTGKIVKALPAFGGWQGLKPFKRFIEDSDSGLFDYEGAAQALSDTMRPMTNDQRATFLQLLPRWTGTLETAASAAKKLYKR